MKKEETKNKALNKTDVSSSDFRILEYKDHFRVQKRTFVDNRFYFLGIGLWVIGKKEEWNTILKDKSFLNIRNFMETEKFQFKTKKECLDFIEDYKKYPIYHYC